MRKKKFSMIKTRTQPSIDFTDVLVGNTHHIGEREDQQDSFGVSNIMDKSYAMQNGILAVVADGMGGLANGGRVSALVVSSMIEMLSNTNGEMSEHQKLLKMLYFANSNVNELLRGEEESGSTVVATLIKNNVLSAVSVGDSHIYLYRKGTIIKLNRDHVYGEELDVCVGKGELDANKALADPRRGALTSYIGMGEIEYVDTFCIPLMRGDKIVLATDGVYGTLSDNELAQILVHPPHKASMVIENAIFAKKKPHQDNFTAIIMEVL